MKSLFLALSTLTCLPIPKGKTTLSQLKNSVIFYPIAGLFIGSLLALVSKVPLSTNLQALLALVSWVLLTLAFHLDGLGDCLDGWFGGKNTKERRRIMKDSALGVYGVTGIALVLIFKYVLLEHLFTKNDAWCWLIAIPAAARFSVVLACLIASPPKGDKGLGSQVMGLSFPSFMVSALLLLPLAFLIKWQFTWILILALGVSFLIVRLSKNRIGGLTGDGMGTMIEVSEVCLLFLACLRSIQP